MIAIIEYNAGNIRSVERACKYIGVEARVTSDSATVQQASRIIFPGVGRAKSAMESLQANRLDQVLKEAFTKGIPMLVICIGAQLILDYSEEDDTSGLKLIPGSAKRFQLADKQYKVPHMGWNAVKATQHHPLLEHVRPNDEYYFANAYYPSPTDSNDCFAVTDHGGPFCSALGRKNLFATQFHPEKSGRTGLEMLAAFSQWNGKLKHAE